MDRKFALTALGYAIVGMALGIYMAASKHHGQHVTHAHILLIGFVVSFVYALCHKLWLQNSTTKLAMVQFYVHQLGSILLFIGLFLLYGDFIKEETIEPVLSLGSITVFAGVVMMKILFIRSPKPV